MKQYKAKIKAIDSIYNIEGYPIEGDIPAQIFEKNGNFLALIDTGHDFPCLFYNNKDGHHSFSIVSVIEDKKSNHNVDALEVNIFDLNRQIEQLKERNESVEKDNIELTKKLDEKSKIKRSYDGEGYMILPLDELDDELVENIKKNAIEYILTGKEIAAMYSSTLLEIIKGDTSKKSLNVKLYKCLNEYAEGEIESLLER